MGCTSSKLDDLPAVCLCRERCTFLDEAIRNRYSFAESHVAYLHSLKSLSVSLDRFFFSTPGHLDLPFENDQPILNLPSNLKKSAPSDLPGPSSGSPPLKKIPHHLHSHSHSSGSHLSFDDDSDDDEFHHDDDHHQDHQYNNNNKPYYESSVGGERQDGVPYFQDYNQNNFNPYSYPPGGGGVGGNGGFMNINYMKNHTTPSNLYTQYRPQTINMPSSSYYPPPNNNSDSYNPPNNYYGGGGGAGFFADGGPSSLQQQQQQGSYYGGGGGGYSSGTSVASTSKEPPPPPSPPTSSSWEFINPFEGYESFYPSYTPSRDSRDVREEEGIPELEEEEGYDDDDDEVIVKEVHGHQKFVSNPHLKKNKGGVSIEEEDGGRRVVANDEARTSVGGMEGDPVEYEVHVVDKKVVHDAEERSKNQGTASAAAKSSGGGGFKGDGDVVKEILVQFERASESGNEFSKFLEVGKLQYKRKHGGHNVSSKLLHLPMGVYSSQPSTPSSVDADQDLELRSKTLSSTLHKLYLWEKKLYDEVKVEEKMRILHEQKSRKLKRLGERGAEAQKIDDTRILVRSLSTKIKIAIQVVDKISVKINNLRDDELWPQLNEFIKGLVRMWKSMLECHHSQCQAIGEAKRLDAIAFRKHFSDDHFEATRQLEHDLINWTLRFSYWVGAQKGYVRALNGWLMKCLLYVPEETADGIAPFSPSRVGAPVVFIICNQWSQSLDTISEKEVIDCMRNLSSNVLQLWDKDKTEIRQRMLANKDERKIKSLDKEEQKIQKEIQALDKRMVLNSGDDNGGMGLTTGHVVYQSETSKGGSLQASLQHVLEAMEKFTASSLKVYEDLLQRIEEYHLPREHENVS